MKILKTIIEEDLEAILLIEILKINNNDQSFNSNLGNISDFKKKNYNRNNFNASKLIQKYSDLAREALSSGDKILYESYMQQVEHFVRISENFTQIIKA